MFNVLDFECLFCATCLFLKLGTQSFVEAHNFKSGSVSTSFESSFVVQSNTCGAQMRRH